MDSPGVTLVTRQDWSDCEQQVARHFGLVICPLIETTKRLLDQEIAVSEFSVSDVEALFENDRDQLVRFAIAWYADVQRRDYGEEWDPAEGDQQSGVDKTSEVLGLSQGFLLGFAMFFLYAKARPSGLVQYIRRRRIPHATKVARDVRRIIKSATLS